MIFRFIKYFLKADTYYQVHSPFLFEWAEEVLEDDREYYAFEDGEKLRSLLLTNRTPIQLTDLGAGSKSGPSSSKTISKIAKTAASGPWQCQTLFRLVNFLKPQTMLELGTSLGISTFYQAKAASDSTFISLEGDPELAKTAKFNLKEFKAKQVEIRVGAFEKTLEGACQQLQRLDYVFFDGHHLYQPTIDYFHTCLKFAHQDTVFVFDDIHWSGEMEKAWQEIQAHPKVTATVDLFYMGVVFFKKEIKEKQHLTLAPLSWKPWSGGNSFFK